MDYKENEEDCGKHTCVQCEYFDMWDNSCTNIDNAHPDMSRCTVNVDTTACKHFTPAATSKPQHTCIQCEYCDMWDMTCSNIDNADEDMNRMTIHSDTPACQHFTPEIMEKVK